MECDGGANANRNAIPDWGEDEPEYPDDPPVFKTELAYLKRHGMLLAGEEAATSIRLQRTDRNVRAAAR